MPDDSALIQLAARQHSLLAWQQARALGFTREALRHRVKAGRLEQVTPRVLGTPGAVLTHERTLMAATLDAGADTFVSRHSAAALWGVPGFAHGGAELTRQQGRHGLAPHIGRLFPVRYLPGHLTTSVRGIPVVTLPYLIFQLAGMLHPLRTERVFETVVTRSPGVLVTLHQLLPELAEHGRNGICVMRELLKQNPPGTRVVASGLEKRFQQILLEAGERPLRHQVDIGGHEWEGRVDFLDDEIAVVFEVDSELYHEGRLAQLDDADRDARMQAAGINEVVRIKEHWVWYEREFVLKLVRDTRRKYRYLRPSTVLTPGTGAPAPVPGVRSVEGKR